VGSRFHRGYCIFVCLGCRKTEIKKEVGECVGRSEISTVDDDELDSDEISEVRVASTFYLFHSGSVK
jgi:hypothetical protein